MNPGDCINKVRFSLNDDTGVLRFEAFDIVDLPDSCERVEELQEYLVGRPLADVDMDYLRGLRCSGDGECMRAAVRMVQEYQRLFARKPKEARSTCSNASVQN